MNIVKVPEILLPKKQIDLKKWSVIACDQFTSQIDYWKNLEKACGDITSLKIIFPEIYLNDNMEGRIKDINANMYRYLESGVFESVNGFILTVRTTKYGNKRIGLMLAFDLEAYDVDKKLAVRATEATVKERIPVRVKIRQNAPIELPHSIVLIDDDKKQLIERLYENRHNLKKLYETELNMQGGRVEGYLVEDTDFVVKLLDKMSLEETMLEKYGTKEQFLFAVGDGNHSIATAKACWENLKNTLTNEEIENHPARYFLTEVNNIYDDAIKFEPIYRVLFGADETFIFEMQKAIKGESQMKVIFSGKEYWVNVPKNSAEAIKVVQDFIDGYIKTNEKIIQDYIHGLDNLVSICSDKNAVGILMPTLEKGDLFKFVAAHGVLTRKSFSMGEAEEKRYYLEARKIIK